MGGGGVSQGRAGDLLWSGGVRGQGRIWGGGGGGVRTPFL